MPLSDIMSSGLKKSCHFISWVRLRHCRHINVIGAAEKKLFKYTRLVALGR